MAIKFPSQRNKLTPPELAREWGIAPEKVIGWIRSGELAAIDAAARLGGKRPRYLIDREEIARFEARRATRPTPRAKRLRRQVASTETFGF
jgi:hypothetical protein